MRMKITGVICLAVLGILVICGSKTNALNFTVRLSGTNANAKQGRVEIYFQGQWGTICSHGWDSLDAAVVCRTLGLPTDGAIAYTSSPLFGPGTGPIWFDNLGCDGSETNIGQCRNNGIGIHNCQHAQDAGVSCYGDISKEDIHIGDNIASKKFKEFVSERLVASTAEKSIWNLIDKMKLKTYLMCQEKTICKVDNKIVKLRDLQLLASDGAIARTDAAYGRGIGTIWLDDVRCIGYERSIAQCGHPGWTVNNCNHREDAGVVCINDIGPVNVRLRGALVPYQGRAEIQINGIWGTICNEGFTDTDATVFCRQANYSVGTVIGSSAPGDGPIWFSNPGCTGTEARITDCTHPAFGNYRCNHNSDVMIQCVDPNALNFTVRLSGTNANARQGRVEMYFQGQWGTICSRGWDSRDAAVVCRTLGLAADGAIAYTSALFGTGTGPIWLDNLGCNGSETNIGHCHSNGIGIHDCQHTQDAGVSCYGATSVYAQINVTLVGGNNSQEGTVMIQYMNNWGTICDDRWDYRDAMVICRMLGFTGDGAIARTDDAYGRGIGPIWLDDVGCIGDETSIVQCQHPGWTVNNCNHREDAGVVCINDIGPVNVRLRGALAPYQGRAEIQINGIWGTICNEGFTDTDATVFCRQANYSVGTVIRSSAPGDGPIWFSNPGCTGTEARITDCPHPAFGNHRCDNNLDVMIQCVDSNALNFTVRLSGTNANARQGRVEMYIQGQWGTICSRGWDSRDAAVVCRTLGLATDGAIAYASALFGTGTGPILLDNLGCDGNETNIGQCHSNGIGIHNCQHTQDAGVSCYGATSVYAQVNVTLIGGNSSQEGTVMIQYMNNWGTICDDRWDHRDAMVICRMLGFTGDGAIARTDAAYGRGIGTIWLDDVGCIGDETSIAQCLHPGWTVNNCNHREDAGVVCISAIDTELPTTTEHPTATEHVTATEPATATESATATGSVDTSCENSFADIIWLVDTSGSVSAAEWNQQVQFIRSMVNLFTIGPNAIQIGAVTFSTTINNEFYLNRFAMKDEVLAGVDRIRERSGTTHLSTGLEFVRTNSFNVINGDRPNAPNILIVLTDGRATRGYEPHAEVDLLKQAGVRIIAIGVGSMIDRYELQAMASTRRHAVEVSDFTALPTILDEVYTIACEGPLRTPMP